MAKYSKIEWTDHTFNSWIGCTRVSPACDDCYAARSTPARAMHIAWGAGQPRQRTSKANWKVPKTWNRQHVKFFAEYGRRQRVFSASLSDWLDNEVPIEWLIDFLRLVMETPNLDWLLLTKRIGNWQKRLGEAFDTLMRRGPQKDGDRLVMWLVDWFNGKPPANVWLGSTIVNQEEADRDIPKLLAIPARVRFLSMEPLLGPVDLASSGGVRIELGNPDPVGRIINQRQAYPDGDPDGSIAWVIVGGESGYKPRPLYPEWVRSLRDQCDAAGIEFLFKQWGELVPGELQPNPEYPDDKGAWRLDQAGRRWHRADESLKPSSEWAPVLFSRIGKQEAGRLLDGRTYDGFPQVTP